MCHWNLYERWKIVCIRNSTNHCFDWNPVLICTAYLSMLSVLYEKEKKKTICICQSNYRHRKSIKKKHMADGDGRTDKNGRPIVCSFRRKEEEEEKENIYMTSNGLRDWRRRKIGQIIGSVRLWMIESDHFVWNDPFFYSSLLNTSDCWWLWRRVMKIGQRYRTARNFRIECLMNEDI